RLHQFRAGGGRRGRESGQDPGDRRIRRRSLARRPRAHGAHSHRLRREMDRLQDRDLCQYREGEPRSLHRIDRRRARRPSDQGLIGRAMATALIDGITTRYEVLGTGPPLLMYSPGGFNATVETWSTQGVYAKIKLLDHLPQRYTCIVFDRRETGQSGRRTERVTWAHYVAQGKGLLDHLGIERAHIMGGCMGCCPVLAFAVAHPQATASMILYWPVGGAKYR